MRDYGFDAGDRLALFIDGANLYFTTKTLGFDIDYRKLLTFFQSRGRLVRAFYYTALFDEHEYSPIRPLVDWLDYNGYSMVTKPAKEYTDYQGRRKVKGNMDMELAIDMMELSPHLDHAVLFSGDGDFTSLLQAVQRRGLKVTVVSTMRTQPPMIADELRRQADHYIDLVDIAETIARTAGSEPLSAGKAGLAGLAPKIVPRIVPGVKAEKPADDKGDDDQDNDDDYDQLDGDEDDDDYRLDPYGEASVEKLKR